MEKKKVIVFDKRADSEDSWRELFLSALKYKADVKLIKYLSYFFFFEGKLDVLIYLKRKEEIEYFNDTLSYFARRLDAKLVTLGYNLPKKEIPAGFIGISQKDFFSEEELINAVLGET